MGYTPSVKTAISIDTTTVAQAEKLGMSRSKLHTNDDVTVALNKVYGTAREKRDEFEHEAARQVFEHDTTT